MEHVEVQGEKVPALGLGTWKLQGNECRKAVEDALDIGYRHIDTAQAYGNEAALGTAINDSEVDRDDVWLTTKIWRSNSREPDVISSFQKSLEKLQTSYVDLLLIHWPSIEASFEETLGAMAKLVGDGIVRNIGVSNFTSRQLDRAIDSSSKKLLTDQVEYHPFLDQSRLLQKCRELDIILTAYSPLAMGDVAGNEVLEEIGSKYEKTAAQVALRWLVQQEKVAAIPRSSSSQHREENFDIFSFELSRDEMEKINSLRKKNIRKLNPEFAPNWD